jgi:intracellular sulfur oxidation DsrE/DsrF family protein
LNRKGFLASSVSVAAVPALAETQSIPGGTHRVERRADFDEGAFAAAVGRTAQIRQLYEALEVFPGVFGSIKNSFNGLQFGFGYPDDAIAIVLAGHGQSAVYGYSDYIWQKYRIGQFFKLTDEKGAPISSNVYLRNRVPFNPAADPDDPSAMYQDTSIQMLQRRGLIVLTCHTAVEEQARSIVQKGFAPAGMSGSEVADDILTHLIPGALVVPSMVATIAVLQNKYGYAYLTPA